MMEQYHQHCMSKMQHGSNNYEVFIPRDSIEKWSWCRCFECGKFPVTSPVSRLNTPPKRAAWASESLYPTSYAWRQKTSGDLGSQTGFVYHFNPFHSSLRKDLLKDLLVPPPRFPLISCPMSSCERIDSLLGWKWCSSDRHRRPAKEAQLHTAESLGVHETIGPIGHRGNLM